MLESSREIELKKKITTCATSSVTFQVKFCSTNIYVYIYIYIIITYLEWAKLLHPHLPVIFIVYPGTIAFQSSPPSTSWKISKYIVETQTRWNQMISSSRLSYSQNGPCPLWALLLSKPRWTHELLGYRFWLAKIDHGYVTKWMTKNHRSA